MKTRTEAKPLRVTGWENDAWNIYSVVEPMFGALEKSKANCHGLWKSQIRKRGTLSNSTRRDISKSN